MRTSDTSSLDSRSDARSGERGPSDPRTSEGPLTLTLTLT